MQKNKLTVELLPITENDLEFARVLRNTNKEYFFYQKTISKEQQKKWFVNLQVEFYIIWCNNERVGTIAIRQEEAKKPITLNNILIAPAWRKKGILTMVFQEIKKIYKVKDFSLEVRADNWQAILVYVSLGFKQTKITMQT